MPIDATLRSLGLRFLRFQDDIKVFAGEQHELRRALLELMPVVRSLHINLSSAKTKILTGMDVIDHFEDMEKDALEYGININEPGVSEHLQDFFDRAVGGDEVNERDVRFAVYRFEKLGDPYAVRWIMENIVDVPYLASLLVRYLSSHLSNADLGIEAGVRRYLNDPRQNLSPVVELHLVRMLANAPELEDGSMELAWATLRDQNKHPSVRQFAARCIGRHARHGDGAVLHATFQAAVDNPTLRRALLVALFECGVATQGFLKQVADSDSHLAPTARYLRSVDKLPPP
jgi:hypothetical protein